MKISDICIQYMKNTESCAKWDYTKNVFMPYPDSGGLSTIGYGHKLTHIDLTSGIFFHGLTQHGCELLFIRDLLPVETFLNRLFEAQPITQGQFDALADFTFNTGIGTMHRLFTQYLFDDYPLHIVQYNHDANGNLEPGLVKRRHVELNWWYEGASNAV